MTCGFPRFLGGEVTHSTEGPSRNIPAGGDVKRSVFWGEPPRLHLGLLTKILKPEPSPAYRPARGVGCPKTSVGTGQRMIVRH